MTRPDETVNVASLKHGIHGEPVGSSEGFFCDYCGASIPIDDPVCYEVIRVADLPNLEDFLDVPDGWHLDASRFDVLPRLKPWDSAVDESRRS